MWLPYFSQYVERELVQFLGARPWNYKNDLCMTGAALLAEATGEETWNRVIADSGKRLLKEDGSVEGWKEGEHNIDKVSFGKSLALLRNLTGEERYAQGVRKAYAFLDHYPRTVTGNFWHKDIYPNQVWLDGLYMAMPFYAGCLTENGEDRWDDIVDQFQSAHDLLWDEKKKLYIHGCDVSRQADWADPETGRSPAVWLRAEGWYLMALADVYELAVEHTPRAGELKELLGRALDGILPYQDERSHMFLQVVDCPDTEGNYPETSGSAMVAYALMKGARLGMVEEAYGRKGSQVLDGIRDAYLEKEEDGWHLYGICASAGLGPGPDPHNRKDRTGTPEYYVSEAQMRDNQHGTAACMMAVSEQIRRNGR
ncbi:MAG: glycosyl hydrolase [Hungatella sp.]|nr:glycosyl hydrolase [Hungatella sp.]